MIKERNREMARNLELTERERDWSSRRRDKRRSQILATFDLSRYFGTRVYELHLSVALLSSHLFSRFSIFKYFCGHHLGGVGLGFPWRYLAQLHLKLTNHKKTRGYCYTLTVILKRRSDCVQ